MDLSGTQVLLALDMVLAVPVTLVDCRIHADGPDASSTAIDEQAEPLRQSVQHSLTKVDHQIRLLRSVLWWYLLPLALPILAYCVQVMWRERLGGWLTVLVGSVVLAFVLLVFAGVYWLNRYAVGAELEPRRRELETLLTSLDDEPSDSGIVRRQDHSEAKMRGQNAGKGRPKHRLSRVPGNRRSVPLTAHRCGNGSRQWSWKQRRNWPPIDL